MDNILGLQMLDEANEGQEMNEMISTWSSCCTCTTSSENCTWACTYDLV